MNKQELSATANAMVADNKGLLAADESTGTMGKRLDSIGVENVEDNRRDYREMMFRSEGIGNYISGVILYDETLRQNAADGTPLAKLLNDTGVIPGIKVDMGAKDLPGRPAEKITEGLDGLPGRVEEYYNLGARFAKWRAVIDIADAVGSTSQLIAAAASLPQSKMIVATDRGIFFKMQQAVPDKELLVAPTGGSGATCRSCASCPWMGMNGLENLLTALEQGSNEVFVDTQVGIKAMKSLGRMIDFRNQQNT